MIPTAVVLTLIAANLPVQPRAEPRSAAEFYNAYRWYGLPLPPMDAVLTRWVEPHILVDGVTGEREAESQTFLGFVVRPQVRTEPAIVWYGTEQTTEYRPSRLKSAPPHISLEGLGWREADRWLVFAAQAWHLGHRRLAEEALGRGRVLPSYGQYDFDVPANTDHVLHILRKLSWTRAYENLSDPGTDRKALLVALRRVAAEDGRFRGEGQTKLLRSLEATVNYRPATPGTTEVLIDGLTECAAPWWGRIIPGREPTAYTRLVEQGFDAIPAILAHIADERLTRTPVLEGFNRGMSIRPGTVSESCYALIEHLTDRAVVPYREVISDLPDGKRALSHVALEPAVYRAKVTTWLERARKTGEEKWATDRVLRVSDGTYDINTHLLRLIRVKYPHHLPSIYRKVTADRPGTDSLPISLELAVSTLDRDTKRRLLLDGTKRPQYHHRRAAVFGLEHVDRATFRVAVRGLLDQLATDGAVEDSRKPDPDDVTGEINALLTRADDPACWAALVRACRSLPVLVRIRLIDRLVEQSLPRDPRRAAEPLRVVEALLADPTVRNDKLETHNFPYPGYEYPNIAVQNYAALKLADYFDIDVPWNLARTPAEWSALRERMRWSLDADRSRGGK